MMAEQGIPSFQTIAAMQLEDLTFPTEVAAVSSGLAAERLNGSFMSPCWTLLALM
jgi:hypothetical protein